MPQHQAENVSISPLLHWTCSDPDGDSLTYDVYLDSAEAPRLVSSRRAAVVFVPDTLASSQKYYWKVVARDSKGDTSVSPIWEFTTLAVRHWSAMGGGTNGTVRSLVAFNGMLIVGGEFTSAGGVEAQHIAAWDGAAWSPLGAGTAWEYPDFYHPEVTALAVYHGQLIAGGGFSLAGGKPIRRIAAWNGSEWNALGDGVTGVVNAMAVYQDRLMVGSYFDSGGSHSASIVSAWNGSSWSSVGSGVDGMKQVLTMFVNEDQLIIGGVPTSGRRGCAVAIWDGTSWTSLGSNMGAAVYAITAIDHQLVVAGEFRVSLWSQSEWKRLGPELLDSRHMNGVGYALGSYWGQLILGGGFDNSDGVSMNYVAAWDGVQWSSVGQGANDDVYAVLTLNDQLIIGGRFGSVGGVTATCIAVWGN
jgi:trimeric autotransporter adhesin